MKHVNEGHVALLDRLLEEADRAVGPDLQALMAAYLDAVIEANLKVNLTRISDPVDGIRLHLLDSLLALAAVEGAPAGALLDLGTGGGFPGVPLCIAAQRSGVLLDSVGKKVRAVASILVELGLGSTISAVNERAEDHARRCPGEYSVVTARAVSELAVLVELAAPLLRKQGRLVALKGTPSKLELDRGRRVAALVGMHEVQVTRADLPMGGEHRCIVVYERTGISSTELPRRTGQAQRFPLAQGVRQAGVRVQS